MEQNYPWESEFKKLYDQTKLLVTNGEKKLERLFTEENRSFLTSIGSKPIEIYDAVDDIIRYGEPCFEDVLEIHRMRYDYFVSVQKGASPPCIEKLRAKDDALEGIPWLPRAIDKVRAKLAGRLEDDYFYPCAGDRQFLKKIGMSPPDFFRLVRDSSSDDEILKKVKSHPG